MELNQSKPFFIENLQMLAEGLEANPSNLNKGLLQMSEQLTQATALLWQQQQQLRNLEGQLQQLLSRKP